MILEACVGNLNEAIIAESLGAHQIELCDRLDLDGISPSIEVVNAVSNKLNIPVKVIINPNPFNYIYSDQNINSILDYVQKLNNLEVHGIVFGPLTKEGLPDLEAIKIVSEATPLPITYHKAIDISKNIINSTELLKRQDIVKFILSSGGAQNAKEGIDQLSIMKNVLESSPIQLIAAGRITSKNLNHIHQQLGLSYYHGKKIVGNLDSSTSN
jgi:copper homeostasis protein